MTVTTVGKGNVVHSTGDTTPVEIEFTYSPYEPYSITATFHIEGKKPVGWEFGRDLLAEALWDYAIHGELDVTIWRFFPNILNLRLESPDGNAFITTTDSAARDCLDQSYALVPAGAESIWGDSDDAAWALILGGAA